ncbi:MAG: PIN domain-containing protein, partial [Patescibacteria group bacterium]
MRLLFVDANIYLHFIRPSNENINSLDELGKLIDDKKVLLVLPKITKNEFLKNISFVALGHQKIIDKKLEPTPNIKSPEVYKIYEDYLENLQKLSSSYLQSVKSLRQRIIKLYDSNEKLNETGEVLEKAYFRKLKGDPPGKKDHIGDELVWEMLLQYCKDKNYDLSIVTQDLRWEEMMSDSKDKSISLILKEEWEASSKGAISIFNTVGEFINSFTGNKKIQKEDIELESQVNIPLVYGADDIRGTVTYFTQSNLGVVSPVSIPSIDQWQPVNMVGGTEVVQCFSCGRWIQKS